VGFGGLLIPALFSAAAVLLVAVLLRSITAGALALVVASGAALAASAEASDSRCRATLVRSAELLVRLAEPAEPGAFARGTAVSRGCVVPLSVAVARGRGVAGATVRVRGTALRSDHGLVVRDAVLVPLGPPSVLAGTRNKAGEVIDRVFGPDAPLARALLIADERAIPRDLRERFAAAGLVHMLSISGLHVGIIALAMQLVFRAARLPPRWALAASVATTALYVAIIGAPSPAVRSGVMLGVAAACRIAQRPTSPWAALALGALVPLAEPRTILEVGYQLSVAGIAALIASGAIARRVLTTRIAGWRLDLARALLASAMATVVTAPLVAWSFGRISLIAPISNLFCSPLMAVAQPMLFLGLLLGPAVGPAHFVADAAHPLLVLVTLVADRAAAVPFAALEVAPGPASACAAGVAAASLVVAAVSRFPGRALATCVAALALLVWMPSMPTGWRRGEVELHLLDVGQGDAVAVRSDGGRWILFDAGRVWRGGDAGRTVIVPYLRRRGGALRAFVLSHPHADHVGGAATVVRALRPREFWDAAFAAGNSAYRDALVAAASDQTAWRRVHPGDTLRLDGVEVAFLAPDSLWTIGLSDPNLASAIAMVRFGAVRFLLVGDAERPEEGWLLDHSAAGSLRADVLKVGHHGSSTSSTAELLDAVRPRVALISVGAGNRYGHPNAAVLAALAKTGAVVLRTDQQGTVVVRTDGRRVRIEANGDAWDLSPRSSAP
jgi:competence protein ComEC